MTQDALTQADFNRADARNRLTVVENELLDRIASSTGDREWLDKAKSSIQEAFMFWKRGIFDGKRVGDD